MTLARDIAVVLCFGPSMHLFILFLGVGCGVAILVKAADWFTDAALALAQELRLSEMIVGATIVSLATTLPEFAVSFIAAWQGHVDVCVGNAVGSTICNIGLILGLCAIIGPMAVTRAGFVQNSLRMLVFAALFGVSALRWPAGSRWTGIVMLLGLFFYFLGSVRSSLREREVQPVPAGPGFFLHKILFFFLLGTAGLVVGSQLMVRCAVGIAETLGVSELIISLTIVAIGTSTPELVVSLTSIIKKRPALSVGNIIGANILNFAWVIGASSLLTPLPVRDQTRRFDIPFSIALSLLLLMFGFTERRLTRLEGGILFGVYVAYFASVYFFWGRIGA